MFNIPTRTACRCRAVELWRRGNCCSSKEIGRRLIALLKIQVGALSKLLHSSKATSFLFLRKYVDSLIRTIASLDEDAPLNANVIEAAFKEVIAAYEKVSI